MDNTAGSSQPIIRRRGRPRRQPSNIPIPRPNQTVAAESRRRRRQVIDANRNREMLNTNNPIVQLFRTTHERISLDASDQFCIRLFGKPDAHGDIYSAPVASEVVGLIVGDVGSADVGRDIIIQDRASRLQRINENHRKFMAMQYPYGNLTYRTTARTQSMQRNKVTMLECYAYRLHDRPGDFHTPLRCKRLTQSYEVDSYCCVEGSRIAHYRTPAFQSKYRSSPFNSLINSVSRGITFGSSIGQRIILPASFTGGPRYLYQNYQDSIAICRKYGCLDLFLTFTSNSAWPEIREALASIPGQQPSNRPDIVNRVFKMKLNILMDDIKKHKFFGPINAGSQSSSETINEIDNYLECRCVTPNDAAWRLQQFDIHHTDPSVERLPVHLPFENNVIFTEDDDLEEVIEDPNSSTTKLTAWLEANRENPSARQLTYIEFPEHWTWHNQGKYWDGRRGSQRRIGRIAYVNPSQGEAYYLRMLLHIVKGPRSFAEIRTISGHEYPTFRAAYVKH
ncbi:hypothetical protein OsI_38264 [Oryza sativa Indica Group]|uniref:Helitron helicase-like domain-containing protein n=1 Tax=Oryza sativa subsp. indica TaxID=39946 RepID=B8BPJ5_ORYSI|nr:hypothetical protein OsI_38264 [Oryza sativa Indica Group]